MEDSKLANMKRFLATANALLSSMETSLRLDPTDVWRYGGYKQYIRKYNQLVRAIAQVEPIDTIIDLYDEEKTPGAASTIACQQKELFESVHANLSVLRAWLEEHAGVRDQAVDNLKNFLQASLRSALHHPPENEATVQDALETLLIGRGLLKGQDYDRETGRVKVSVKECIPDFIFPRLGLALEVKLCKDQPRAKQIVDEINADIAAYSKQYRSLLFVVYDLGIIRDEGEFRRDLERAASATVILVKH